MAKLYKNILIQRLAGTPGDPFMKRGMHSGQAVLAERAMFDDSRKQSETQKTDPGAVREGTTYASFAQTQEVYINKAKRTGATAYYLALADWFGAPRVTEINVDDWTGEIGQTIRVKARDNVLVARVSVLIRDAGENLLEMGEAVQSEAGSAWWTYTTKSLVPMMPFPIVEVTAYDLPGNSDSFVIS